MTRPVADLASAPLELPPTSLASSAADAITPSTAPSRSSWSTHTDTGILLAVGIMLGPHGVAILNAGTLALLDPVVPVALAAIGVLAVFDLGTAPGRRAHAFAESIVRGVVAAAIVAAGTTVLATITTGVLAATSWMTAVVLGICASTSAPLAQSADDPEPERGLQFDVLLPIVIGGLAVVAWREGAPGPAAAVTVQMLAIALIVAGAGSLLLGRPGTEQEQRVFSAATLLLLGGAADYLSFSALLTGLAAGAFWRATGSHASGSARRDLTRLQHPLLALILLVAGAQTALTPATLALAGVYAVLRTIGVVAGGIATGGLPRLLPPGVVGVAFAVNAARGAGPEMSVVLSVAVLGTIGAQLLAAVVAPQARA